ncbi:MAG: hypothetical protein AAGH15_07655 [Myxococcota bacterium]
MCRAFSLLLFVTSLGLAGCNQNGSVDRLSGEGCQAACVTINTTGSGDEDRRIECLDPDLSNATCASQGAQPNCELGLLACEGRPVCIDDTTGETFAPPVCTR